MTMNIKLAAAAIGAAGFAFTAASASTVVEVTDPTQAATFSSFSMGGAGTHGAELRGGNPNTWELGLGPQTSQPNNPRTFVEANYTWIEDAAGQSFRFEVTTAGVGTLDVGGVTLTWDEPRPMQLGNAVEIFANRLSQVNITSINGHAFSTTVGDFTDGNSGESKVFFSEDFVTDGLVLEGTLGIVNGGNSANLVFIKLGDVDVDPVPVPAAGLLLGGAFGAGLFRKLRKR
ncbi:MAG: hypothetical protein AAGH41_06825 [Pseudomonadota bacterium]